MKKNKNLKQVTITGIGPLKPSKLKSGGHFRHIYCKEYGPGSWYDQMDNASAWLPFIQEIQSNDALLCHAKIKYDRKSNREILNCDHVPDIITRFGKIKLEKPQPKLEEQIEQDSTTLKNLVDDSHVQKHNIEKISGLAEPCFEMTGNTDLILELDRKIEKSMINVDTRFKNGIYDIYGPNVWARIRRVTDQDYFQHHIDSISDR